MAIIGPGQMIIASFGEGGKIAYPTVELAEIIADQFRQTDPDVRIQNYGNLENTIYLTRDRYNGKKTQREKVVHKAAYLLYSLASKAHAFLNGNKRMAYMLTIIFLNMNGFDIRNAKPLPEKDLDLVKFILQIASGEVSLDTTIKWIDKNLEEVVDGKLRFINFRQEI